MRAVASTRIVNNGNRWLMSAVIAVALSSLQSSLAVASICQLGSGAEVCRCTRSCKDRMHDSASNADQLTAQQPAMRARISTDSTSPGVQCCSLPQSEKPVVTSSTQETPVEFEAALIALVREVAIATIRTHDPPNSRPMYLTN